MNLLISSTSRQRYRKQNLSASNGAITRVRASARFCSQEGNAEAWASGGPSGRSEPVEYALAVMKLQARAGVANGECRMGIGGNGFNLNGAFPEREFDGVVNKIL